MTTWLDIESTGLDVRSDRIVEICVITGDKNWVWRVNPGIPIPAQASKVHGITDADVAEWPGFTTLAPDIQEATTGQVLGTYNGRRFDDLMLDAELRRAGCRGLRNGAGRIANPELDLKALWDHCEPRDLKTAAKRFAGIDLENAHSAAADTEVLPPILAGMRREFGLDGTDEELAALCVPAWEVDRDGRFRRDDEGVIRFSFGNHRGKPVHDEPSYLGWMTRADFSDETKSFAEQFIEEIEARRQALLQEEGLELVGVEPELPF